MVSYSAVRQFQQSSAYQNIKSRKKLSSLGKSMSKMQLSELLEILGKKQSAAAHFVFQCIGAPVKPTFGLTEYCCVYLMGQEER